LLRSGFERCGDISADAQFRAMTTDSSPTLSEALSPWLNPETMDHNLALQIGASNGSVLVGDTFDVGVTAETGLQLVDGAAFLLKYDPQRFMPVDSTGALPPGLEPGLVLPAVMGNWIDVKNGIIGFTTGTLQGDAKSGSIPLGSIRFRVLQGAISGPAQFEFASGPSPFMQLTNGGENLLARTYGLTVTVQP